jgi:hypothetical protein
LAKKSAVQKEPKSGAGYRDIFNPKNLRRGPLVLSDMTSIEWPAGWTQVDADRWRKTNGLEKPRR